MPLLAVLVKVKECVKTRSGVLVRRKEKNGGGRVCLADRLICLPGLAVVHLRFISSRVDRLKSRGRTRGHRKCFSGGIETLLALAVGVMQAVACNKGFRIPGKTSAAPEKYEFEYAEDFIDWAMAMFRARLVGQQTWPVRDRMPVDDKTDDPSEAIQYAHKVWLNKLLKEDGPEVTKTVPEVVRLECSQIMHAGTVPSLCGGGLLGCGCL